MDSYLMGSPSASGPPSRMKPGNQDSPGFGSPRLGRRPTNFGLSSNNSSPALSSLNLDAARMATNHSPHDEWRVTSPTRTRSDVQISNSTPVAASSMWGTPINVSALVNGSGNGGPGAAAGGGPLLRKATSNNSSPDLFGIGSSPSPNGGSMEVGTPVPSAQQQARINTPVVSIFQSSLTLIEKLYAFPLFEHFLFPDGVESLDPVTLDPIAVLWHCFRLGAPLCVLYNFLNPRQALKVADVSGIVGTRYSNVCKDNVYHFIVACKRDWAVDAKDMFTVSELYKDDTNDFVKVMKVVNVIVDKIEQSGLSPPKRPLPLQIPVPQSDLAPADDNRSKLINEMIETERKYVHDLEHLQSYEREITHSQILDKQESICLFSNLDEVLDFQRKFLIGMERVLSLPTNDQRIGQLFVANEEAFDVYNLICANYQFATEFALQESDRLSRLSHLIPPHMLQSYLIKPVQRICKYPLLLAELVKLSGKTDYPFMDELKAGLDSIKRVTERMNEQKRVEENRHTKEDLEENIEDWKGLRPEDFGDLHLKDQFPLASNELEREYILYLFERILLCCKSIDKAKRKSRRGEKEKERVSYVLRGNIYVNSITEIQDTSDPTIGVFSLKVYWKDIDSIEGFSIKCRNMEQVTLWKDRLQRLVDADHLKKRPATADATKPKHPAPHSLPMSRSFSTPLSTLPQSAAEPMPAFPRALARGLSTTDFPTPVSPITGSFAFPIPHSSSGMAAYTASPVTNTPNAFPLPSPSLQQSSPPSFRSDRPALNPVSVNLPPPPPRSMSVPSAIAAAVAQGVPPPAGYSDDETDDEEGGDHLAQYVANNHHRRAAALTPTSPPAPRRIETTQPSQPVRKFSRQEEEDRDQPPLGPSQVGASGWRNPPPHEPLPSVPFTAGSPQRSARSGSVPDLDFYDRSSRRPSGAPGSGSPIMAAGRKQSAPSTEYEGGGGARLLELRKRSGDAGSPKGMFSVGVGQAGTEGAATGGGPGGPPPARKQSVQDSAIRYGGSPGALPPSPAMTPPGMQRSFTSPAAADGAPPLSAPPAGGGLMKVRMHYESDVFIIAVPVRATAEVLRGRVEKKVRLSGNRDSGRLTMKWRDPEGRFVEIEGDEDVARAFEVARGGAVGGERGVVNLFVWVA